MNDERWELPERFRLDTPEKLATAQEYQDKIKASAVSPFASLTPLQQSRAQAVTIIEHLTPEIERIDKELAEEDPDPQLIEGRQVLASRLAEAHALVGRYDLAAEIDPRPDHKVHHLAMLEAIHKDDEEKCECGPGRTFIEAEVYSVKHGRVMPLISCNGCGHRNVTTAPPHLLEQRSHRAKARELVGHMKPHEAKANLERIGHTHENLIGQ